MAQLARESNPAAWQLALAAPQQLVIRGQIADPTSLDYLRDTIGVVAASLEGGGAAVFDPQILTVFGADEWRAQFFEDAFETTKHAVILVSPQDDGRVWLHTRGMRVFGRPDLSLPRRAPRRIGRIAIDFQRPDAHDGGGRVDSRRATSARGEFGRDSALLQSRRYR